MMGEISPRGRDERTPPAAQLRASHEDRDRVIDVLRIAAGDGRLTADELDERLELAFNARTYGELAALTADLPATAGGAGSPAVPKDVVRIDCASGHAQRDGGWVVPKRLEVRVSSGHVKLDFTQAAIVHPTLHVDAEVRSGYLLFVTKPGIAVDTDEIAVRSGHVNVKAPWGTDVPVSLLITVSGTVGSGHVQARPPRRTFWQWLLRRPRRYAITAN